MKMSKIQPDNHRLDLRQ